MGGNKNSILNTDNRVFNYLRKISYRIYMFHPIAIVVMLHLLKDTIFDYLIMQHLFSLLLTIGIATISYKFLKTAFLKRKVKFSKVLSGDNAR